MADLKNWLEKLFIDKEMKKRIEFFGKVSIFAGLPRNAVGKLITIMYHRSYEPGEVVCAEGEFGKALFIVMSGEVILSRKPGILREEKVISTMESGDFFGEMALLEEKPRTATAKAVTKSEVYIIYKANFDSMAERDPRVGFKVIRNIAVIIGKRLRGMLDEENKGG
jgi:CRP/FNR family transcriptional regulator, cyclic AMP receptor protein